jgi:glycosyltransferase involved in cell wall biosynthesis
MNSGVKETKGKVSIIIPVYNGEKYLKDAIESSLNQTYSNIEIKWRYC